MERDEGMPLAGQDATLAEVSALLAAHGAATGGLRITPLGGGVDNLTLLLEVGGRRLVLRRYDVTPPAEVEWEPALIAALCARGFPTAPLLATLSGERHVLLHDRPAALFAFVEGTHLGEATPEGADAAALAIAGLHRLAGDLVLPQARSPLDLARLARLEAFAAQGVARPGDPDLPAILADAAAFRSAWERRVAVYDGALPRGVVHYDAHAGNLLLHAAGRLVALLDFDEAHPGLLLADVAALVGAWAGRATEWPFSWARAARVVATHGRRRPLTAAEVDLLPDAVALYHLADAAEYVRRALLADPTRHAVADCHAYERFRRLTGSRHWREAARARLLGAK
jgi:Ser/Thr protein kinase RdoA (MazF antagonist)